MCFSLGYWVGSHPRFYDQYLDLTKGDIRLFCPQAKDIFPAQFLSEVQSTSPVKIQVTTENPELADVLLVDSTYLKSLPPAKLKENTTWFEAFKKVSTDFQLQFFKTTQTVPVFWKIENMKLKTLSFVIHMQNYKNQTLQYRLVNLLLSKKIMLRWMSFHDWNSTLANLNESDIDQKRTAGYIRKVELKNLEIQ